MNNIPNPNSSQSTGSGQAEPASHQQTADQPGRCAFEPLCSAWSQGAQRAKAAAEKAVPKIKASLSDAGYWLGYGASFVTVFSYTIVKELAPRVVKTGCRDGARDGQKSAQDLATKPSAASSEPPVIPSTALIVSS